MSPIVDLKNIRKDFGSIAALDNVSLQIAAGEFLTLLGPSGCGKTTLLRLISGFETPSQGVVLINGQDVTHVPPYRRDVNQVFQSYALFPHLTVADNISFGLRMKKLPKEERSRRVADAIELVSLHGLENRKPAELSGGQKQRVALARALVCQPRVLLLDEPLSALDAKLRRAMQIELKRLQEKLGITFVFVTHDQEEALVMSDRIAVMNNGRIEQLGDAASIYHRPRTPFVAGFLGQANLLSAELIHRENRKILRLPGNIEISADSLSDATPGNLLISIRPEKIELIRLATSESDTFPARVEEVIFKGAISQFLLRIDGGLSLTAIATNQADMAEQIHRGDQIACRIRAADIVVVQSGISPAPITDAGGE